MPSGRLSTFTEPEKIDIIERYEAGETFTSIAKSMGRNKNTVTNLYAREVRGYKYIKNESTPKGILSIKWA